MSLHLRQGECFGRGGSRWGDSRDWRLYGSGFTVAGRLCWCSRVPRGWWVLHTRACSVLVGIAESCGTALSVTVMALLPCADPTSPHMGARPPHTTLTEKSRHSNNNQPPPRIDPALPCATPMTTTPTTNSSQNSTELEAEYDRTRSEFEPISTRSTTELEPEMYRTRHGLRPISTRKRTELDTEYDRSRRHPLMRAARPATDCPRTTSSAASAPPAVIGSIDPRADAEPLRRADAGRPRRRSAVPPRRRGR